MKLLDILVRDLKTWPEPSEGCDSITQDDDGLLNATVKCGIPEISGGVWGSSSSRYFGDKDDIDFHVELAEDFATAIVTREQWQAAVDALNSPQPSAIKSLEERIKERAIAALADDVEDAMRRLRNLAQGAEHQPSGVGGLTISEVIDAAGAAIMKARSPVVADKALDRALERLTDSVDPSNQFITAGPSRK